MLKVRQDAKQINDLHPFIELVQDTVGLPVEYVSFGVNPEDMVKVNF
jgi:adenylosuccinate synthase